MENIMKETREKLAKAVEFYENEIMTIRTGRANSILVENIKVDVYGQRMHIKDMSSITIPDPMSIMVVPWDKANLKGIEDAIGKENLGVGVVNSGESIRVTLPELSSERREELKKVLGKKAEDIKVSMRNIRRDAMDVVKKSEKDKDISEDQKDKYEKDIQGLLDKNIKQINVIVENKKKEISQ